MNTQPPESGNGADPAPGVGRLLKASRLRCGEELSDVAAMLCIRYTYLEAIEEDRFQDLPGRAYAIGFIRAYAEHLGLDSAEVVRRFKEDSAEVTKTNLDFPIPVAEKGIPGGAILFVGAMIAVLAYGGWYLNTIQDGYLMELISPLPARLASLVGKDVAGKADPSPAPVPAEEPTPVPADSGQTSAAEGVDRFPPQSAPETEAEAAVSPDRPAETAETPPGTAESESGPGPAPVPVEAESGGPVEGVSADVAAVSPSEPGEGVSPEGATSTEEETPAGEGPEPEPAEAEVQAVTAPATVDAGQDAAGTEQAAIPPATVDAGQDAAGTEQAVTPPATGGEDLSAAPGVNEPEQAVPQTVPAEVEQDADSQAAPNEGVSDAAGTEQAAVPPAAAEPEPAPPAPAAAEPEPAPPAPAAAEPEPAPPAPAAAAPEQAAAQPAAASSGGRVFGAGNANSRIEVRALMNSWIQVRDDAGNRLLMTRMLRAGDSYRVPDRGGLKLLTGNAGALEILVDGEVVPSIGPVGKVLRAVALDSERLRRGLAVDD